ncbi:hypothetical protein Q7C_2572 [Methylophaga frappieri]|uniref:Uncharacterized protein n=1 Tax=Methylophaga frappieri (strain ATCC BAA-2434 / DSM 25690 / JAM7) TaxID=754477 RepID=I1YLA0_METFJ|nr:hypothetical protein [Methylophaga frappieri]AFJ03693.1 hypothetical protein Q7C_2572 [Methylophaga frappieri]
MKKPQATIEQETGKASSTYTVSVDDNGEYRKVEEQFDRYEDALDYLLKQGWQLKRDAPAGSLHVDVRFRKP